MDKPLYSEDPDVIRLWAADCLEAKLYRDDGTARYIFAGEAPIYSMAYIPGVAWSMYHGRPARFGKPNVHGSVFVRPDMRHRGIGKMIGNLAYEKHLARIT